jgi:hypothetical protein
MMNRRLLKLTKVLCSGARARVAIVCLAICGNAWALTRIPDVRAFVSPNGEWIVRIESTGIPSENAKWFRFVDGAYKPVAQARLANALGPALAYVTDRGELLTIGDLTDKTAELAIVAYSSNGRHLKTTTESEIFADNEITCFRKSAEGIDWLPNWGGVEVRGDKNAVQIEDALGGTIIVRMDTGNVDVYPARRADGMRRRGCSQ